MYTLEEKVNIVHFVDLLSAYMCIISGDGNFQSINMSFAANNFEDGFTLTCLSDGGPTTKVKWSRNKVKIEEDQHIYTTSQRILSTSHYPVYENRLIVKRKEGGVYKCEISNYFVKKKTLAIELKSNKSISLKGMSKLVAYIFTDSVSLYTQFHH